MQVVLRAGSTVIGRITGFRLLPIKSILAVRDARLLVWSHAKEQNGGTPGGIC